MEEDAHASWPGFRIDTLTCRHEDSADSNLVLRIDFRVGGLARPADDRLLVNLAFSRESRNPFPEGVRRKPVFLPYALTEVDNLVLAIPREWRPETIPDVAGWESPAGSYSALWTSDGERLAHRRTLILNSPFVAPADYQEVRALYQAVVAGDAVLVPLVRTPLRPSRR
jgi:hypothetical protein